MEGPNSRASCLDERTLTTTPKVRKRLMRSLSYRESSSRSVSSDAGNKGNTLSRFSTYLRKSLADLKEATPVNDNRVSMCLTSGYLALSPNSSDTRTLSRSCHNLAISRKNSVNSPPTVPVEENSDKPSTVTRRKTRSSLFSLSEPTDGFTPKNGAESKRQWRHSYACDRPTSSSVNDRRSLYSISEENQSYDRLRYAISYAPNLALSPTVLFPWRKPDSSSNNSSSGGSTTGTSTQDRGSSRLNENESSTVISLPPIGAATGASRRNNTGTSRTNRRLKTSSSPVLGDRPNWSHSAWDLGRPWSHYGGEIPAEMVAAQSSMMESASSTNIIGSSGQVVERREASSPTPSLRSSSVADHPLRKFRKSLSLRLSRRSSQEDASEDLPKIDIPSPPAQQPDPLTAPLSPKFKFGPLVWRTSRERNKKGMKAARNAKCNSGDSGVQVEVTPTLNLLHEPELESRKSVVRRTQSDLGGDAVITAALCAQGNGSGPVVPAVEEEQQEEPRCTDKRTRKLTRTLARSHLRRSASQPVVLHNGPAAVTTGEGVSDEDAGLFLSEDDLSDTDMIGQQIAMESARNSHPIGMRALVLWDHSAVEPEELSLKSGEIIYILENSDVEWWWALRENQYGWVPASYVQLYDTNKIGNVPTQHAEEPSNKIPQSVRSNAIIELITAERDYVKLLQDVVEGYLYPMRRRPDLFTPKQIDAVFGNLEELYQFQSCFLLDLERSLNWNSLEQSVVGCCFIKNYQGFHIYSSYCNNQDTAATEIQQLYSDVRCIRFFEACRLLRRMTRLPLDAFLLSPVQKICKYPLQLAELLKHTPENHPDRCFVSTALDAMRSMAYLVNESKRRAEMQQQLVDWQKSVENWEGDDITVNNTQLLRQGDLVKTSSSGWTREVVLFLFDKELVICKKELIKRNTLVYKGRLSVENCEVVDVPDGKDLHFNVNTRHAFKLRCLVRDKWYLFSTRSPEEKASWVRSLKQIQQQDLQSNSLQPVINRSHKIGSKRSKGTFILNYIRRFKSLIYAATMMLYSFASNNRLGIETLIYLNWVWKPSNRPLLTADVTTLNNNRQQLP